MDLFKFILSKSRKVLFLSTFFGLLSGLGSTFVVTSIHGAIQNQDHSSQAMWFYLGAMFVFLVTSLLGQLPLFKLAEGSIFELRIQLMRRVLESKLRFIEKLGPSRLLASLTEDVNVLASGMVLIPRIGTQLSICIGCFAYLAYLSPKVFLYILFFLALIILIFKFTMSFAASRFSVSRKSNDQLIKHFNTGIYGAKELRLHHARRKEFFENQLLPTAQTYKENRIRGLVMFQLSTTVSNLAFFLLIGMVMFVMPRFQPIDFNTLSGVVLILIFITGPLGGLINLLPELSRATVSLKAIESLGLELQENRAQVTDESPKTPEWSRLSLNQISHTYYNERKDEQFHMGPISLSIQRGEVLFIVGGNGSGKSTLAKLLTGLYEPEGGHLELDGKVIGEENIESYRQIFSTVFADFYLFENFLGLGNPGNAARAEALLRELHLDHKVKIVGESFSTTELSTGQRKRLALLLTYLEDRSVYLFDEWAADQDPQFKKIFYDDILPDLKKRGKTVIAITHDDHYFNRADRIIKIADGQIDQG